jgi:hypothetical protein
MSNRFDAFREFLTRNEIIFKTVAASALSLMAVLVAIAQLVTALSQKSLSALQTQIVEAQAVPQFEVALHQKLNDATGKFDDDYLVVNNSGGPVRDFVATAMYFIRVRVTADVDTTGLPGWPSRVASAVFDLPVNGYFTSQFVSAAGKGQLVTIFGYRNNAAFGVLAKSISEAPAESKYPHIEKWTSISLDKIIYVYLTYVDLLNRPHEDYYSVPIVGPGSQNSRDSGNIILVKWKKRPIAEFSDLNAERLLKQAADIIESCRGNLSCQQ